jgi:hypothetical protein
MPAAKQASKHHCPGDLYYVDEHCTLHAHHSNSIRQQERRDQKHDSNCSDCFKLKIIYPKSVSIRARSELRRAPGDRDKGKADSVSINSYLKSDRQADYDKGKNQKIRNNYALPTYYK